MSDVVTIDQIRDLIKAEKIRPSDLFGAEVLTDDPVVTGYVKERTKEAVAGEYAHRKRTEEGFDKTRKEFEDKLTEREAEVQKLKLESAKSQIPVLFEKQKAERTLDERQGKWLQNRLAKFTPEKIEELDKEFNAYLDAEVDEYKRMAKDVFGIDTEAEAVSKKGKSGGSEPDDSKGEPDNKYLDPKTNPFIKTD